MKKAQLTILIALISLAAVAQNNDRRGFQGTVSSSSKLTIRPDGKEETKVNTDIQFTARTIVIDSDVYEIVKKAFDGKKQTTFTCTKRRGTFDISYSVGESIRIVDTGNTDLETVYMGLTEN